MLKPNSLPSRRRFFQAGAVFAGAVTQLAQPNRAFAGPTDQPDWRFCNKCESMFYNGYPDKGRCPAGGAHTAQGYNFVLPHDSGETPTAQAHWRFCSKCKSMFFNGYTAKGVCSAGGTHFAQGFNFVLAHDIPETSTVQRHWRFCQKCFSMFFNGYPNKGVCPAGGIHIAQGFAFALPHPTYGCAHCNDGSCQCGYAPQGELCANHRGEDPSLGCSQQQ